MGHISHDPHKDGPNQGIDLRALERERPHEGKRALRLFQKLSRRYTGKSGEPSRAEAEQIKQNALAAKHLLEVRIRSGELVEVAEAEALFFDSFRSERDAWLNWPVRIAPLIAAQFDIDVDLLTEALAHHVNDHLNARGEPDPDFAGEG